MAEEMNQESMNVWIDWLIGAGNKGKISLFTDQLIERRNDNLADEGNMEGQLDASIDWWVEWRKNKRMDQITVWFMKAMKNEETRELDTWLIT